MTTMTFKEFVASKKFISIVPKVRINANKYPFVTLIDAENKAENVYFSKAMAASVSKDMKLTKEFLATIQVSETTNKAGEPRVKLIGNSERVSLEELL